jgi:hypothetical protein
LTRQGNTNSNQPGYRTSYPLLSPSQPHFNRGKSNPEGPIAAIPTHRVRLQDG